MAWTYTTRKISAANGGIGTLNMTLNSTAAGSLIVVGSSVYNAGTGTTAIAVSDNVNGAYTESLRHHNSVQDASLHYIANNAGGNLVITVNPTAATDSYDMWIAAAEFAGGNTASPASGTPVGVTGGGGTNPTVVTAGPMTPADNDVLVIAFEGHTTSGLITENQAAQGFTLIEDHESGTAAEPGSWVYKILTGAPAATSHTWAIPNSAQWASVIAAFKPSAGAPAGHAAVSRFAKSTPGLSPWGVRRM